MVTKLREYKSKYSDSLILAKNHMVTKHASSIIIITSCLILAKNHMVTKRLKSFSSSNDCLILANNHMVTKPQIHVTIYLKIIKY